MPDSKGSYRKRRVDRNQPEIVRALRHIGAKVVVISSLGHGVSDILVGFRGRNYLFEIKDAGGELTEDERKFFMEWSGQVSLIRSAQDAIAFMNEDIEDV